jgi:hypothetical protein
MLDCDWSSDVCSSDLAVSWAVERALASLDGLSDAFNPAAGATLPSIAAPSIGPSGERIDTSVEAPSDPQQRLLVEDNAGIGIDARPSQPLAARPSPNPPPNPAQGAPDLTFEPLGVGRRGERVEVEAGATEADRAAEQGPTEMSFNAPLEVPKSGPNAAASPPSAAAHAQTTKKAQTLAPVVRAWQSQGLRITVFAAGTTSPQAQAYDGLVIERVKGRQAAR